MRAAQTNHPAAVLRRWQKSNVVKPVGAPKTSYVEKLKASVIDLEEKNAKLEQKMLEIEHGGDDLWTPEDTAEDIAKEIFAKVNPAKAKRIAAELARLVELSADVGSTIQ